CRLSGRWKWPHDGYSGRRNSALAVAQQTVVWHRRTIQTASAERYRSETGPGRAVFRSSRRTGVGRSRRPVPDTSETIDGTDARGRARREGNPVHRQYPSAATSVKNRTSFKDTFAQDRRWSVLLIGRSWTAPRFRLPQSPDARIKQKMSTVGMTALSEQNG